MVDAAFFLRSAIQAIEFFMNSGDPERYWNGGDGSNPDLLETPGTMRAYFGEFDLLHLELIKQALDATSWRFTKFGAQLIRCQRGKAFDKISSYTWGIVHLHDRWFVGPFEDEVRDARWRAGRILHEMMHALWSLPSPGFPYDVKSSECFNVDQADSNRCYGEENARLLAGRPDIRVAVPFKNELVLDLPAAVANIDNYVHWMARRFLVLDLCVARNWGCWGNNQPC